MSDDQYNARTTAYKPELVHNVEPSVTVQMVNSWSESFKDRITGWGEPIMLACVAVWHNKEEGPESAHAAIVIKYAGTVAIPTICIPEMTKAFLEDAIRRDAHLMHDGMPKGP